MNDTLANEIEAIKSIYSEDEVEVIITPSAGKPEDHHHVLIRLKFTKPVVVLRASCETYPASTAPTVLYNNDTNPPSLPSITELFVPGEEVLFRYIELVRDWDRERQEKAAASAAAASSSSQSAHVSAITPTPIPRAVIMTSGVEPTILPDDILVSPAVTEKKSKFLGLCYYTSDVRAILAAISMMRSHPLVKGNTHLMYAYKVVDGGGVVRCDNSDDGEEGAGACLAELIYLLKKQNLIVFVARWFGGIELGPLRFKLIKSVAREAIMMRG